MIESGSLVPGVDAADFGLPVGTAMRIERPAASLRGMLTAYAMLDSDPTMWDGTVSWSLPGTARLWIVPDAAPILLQTRNRRTATIERAMVVGPSSRGMPVTSHGGISVVVDVSPLGWARWFGVAADAHRDRVSPLQQMWPTTRVDDLLGRLARLTRAEAIGPTLDRFFTDHLPPPHPDEAMVARATAMIESGAVDRSAMLSDALGITPYALRKLFTRNFGFTPKVVMRRTRFLRALTTMMLTGRSPDAPPGYHDVSHFLRDGSDFLNLTPRRFLALPIPYTRALIRAKALVGVGIGSASADTADSDARATATPPGSALLTDAD